MPFSVKTALSLGIDLYEPTLMDRQGSEHFSPVASSKIILSVTGGNDAVAPLPVAGDAVGGLPGSAAFPEAFAEASVVSPLGFPVITHIVQAPGPPPEQLTFSV